MSPDFKFFETFQLIYISPYIKPTMPNYAKRKATSANLSLISVMRSRSKRFGMCSQLVKTFYRYED